jgi:predicted AlkP superfamily phosphohydrolase/phosphomutase
VAPRLVVLGWDSATFDVIDPLASEGRLPALTGLGSRGFRAQLASTWPPMTDCAWTSAFTGTNPGRHGIFGSWYRAPGAYACRYFSSRDRRAPALWELGAPTRFVVWNVPMSYPPTPVTGAMVAGYGAPPGARFCSPAEVQDDLVARWDLQDLLDRAPHGSLQEFRDDLVRGPRAQAEALVWLGDRVGADCVVAVWPQIDRAQHFFWRRRGSDDPLAGAIERVYEAMDQATALVMEAWPEADVMVISDHGAGALHGDVNVGAWLAARGRASYGRTRRPGLVDLAWSLPPPVRRAGRRIAPGMARRAFAATLAGQLGPFDWDRTHAFCGFHGDLWLNLRGREPRGVVAERDATEVLAELAGGLLAIEDGGGRQVFAAVHPRSSLYSGPAAHMAPDLVLDSWSAGYRVAPRRDPSEVVLAPAALAGVREPWSADHRPQGVFVAGGPHIARGRVDELSLYDVCPTALALLEGEVPDGLDGRVAEEVLDERWLSDHPVRRSGPARPREPGGYYSEDEAGAVAAHLKDLGYIE